jgi:cell wall-associated NlpC family hydrolase
MAFNFPKYYSDDLAAEFVTWWAERLARNEVNPGLVPQIERQVAQTRLLMRPMMRDRLYLLAELEARATFHDDAELRAQIRELREELVRDFDKVAQSAAVSDPHASTYERYVALSQELRLVPRPAPTRKPAPTAPAEPPAKVDPREGDGTRWRPAPLVGDPLIPVDAEYDERVEASVKGWMGTPYLYGGETKRGVDCSAFVREVYRESQRVELPRSSVQQATVGLAVPASRLVPGDIVLFDVLERGRVSHVGVFVGEGLFAHASSSRGVVRDKFDASWAQRAFLGSRRLLTAGSTP